MTRVKSPQGAYFFLLLVLLPCMLFGVCAEFARNIHELDALSSPVSGGEPSESGGDLLLISESFLLYGRTPAQSRVQYWRQLFVLVVCALFLKARGRVALRTCCLYNRFPRKFFHILVISFLLGGRAPPRSA